jgi:hypothetical protein
MDDNAWVLRGVDPETRDQAVEEARRLGLSLADYVTDRLLKSALAEQVVGACSEAAPEVEPSGFGVRERFRALERRLESSVGGLEGAVHALDTAVFDVTARVGEVEGLAGDTSEALQASLSEMATQLAAMRLHVTDVEDNSIARDDEAAAAHASLSQTVSGLGRRTGELSERVSDIETVARRADANAAALASANEALKRAVASDFLAFAKESDERIRKGLRDVTSAADAAAAHADAAVANMVAELRGVREGLEKRIADGADETRRRMQAAFGDAAQRVAALATRVDSVEAQAQRAAEQIRAQLMDVEDAAQTALEETAESLRQAGAALAADLQRSVQDGRAALESVHSDLATEIADLRERQQAGLTRLRQLDAASGAAANELAAVREAMLRRIGESESGTADLIARVQNDLGNELDTLTSRFARFERDSADTHFTLRAETERVETATFASLKKLAADIAKGDAASAASIDDLRQRVGNDMRDLEERQTSVATQLTAIDLIHGAQRQLSNRVSQIEAALEDKQTERKLAAIATELSANRAFAEQSTSELARRLEELRARLAAYENHASVAADGVSDLVRMLDRATTESAEALARSDERIQKLETEIAGGGPVAELQDRLGAMERRQAEALETLRADIARFVGDNDRRLAALESAEVDYNLAAEFDALRRRVEERILGVEQRSVRTLEQVADTVAMLEERFTGRRDDERQSA